MDKQEMIEKLEKFDLTDEQLLEIESVISGQLSDRFLVNKAENLVSKFFNELRTVLMPSKALLWFRLGVLLIFTGLICFLSLREPENSTQVWTIVGAFVGFVFGQKSSILRF